MDRTYLAFTLPNFITVIIMAALGYAVLAGLIKVFRNVRGGRGPYTGVVEA